MSKDFNFNQRKTFPRELKYKSNFISKKRWWAPVWNGLLVDSTGKHYKAMGAALWLYLYLLIYANRTTGKLFRRLSTIADDTGIKVRTISRWLNVLRINGYIETKRTGRSHSISITKWRSIKK